jgi:hypothetical protein
MNLRGHMCFIEVDQHAGTVISFAIRFQGFGRACHIKRESTRCLNFNAVAHGCSLSFSASMDCLALFRDSDSDTDGGNRYSDNSDASDGDEWLRPTVGGRVGNLPVKLSRKQRRKQQKEVAGSAKEKGLSGKKPTEGDTGATKGRRREPTARASVLSSAVSSVAGGLPAPLLFLRQRSLSSSNLAEGTYV